MSADVLKTVYLFFFFFFFLFGDGPLKRNRMPETYAEGVQWGWLGKKKKKIGDDISLWISLPPLCQSEPKNFEVVFDGDRFFLPAKGAEFYKNKSRICLKARHGAKSFIQDLEEPIFKVIQKNTGSIVEIFRAGWGIYRFSGDLFSLPREEACNILLFGMAGSGKSSFINSAMTIISHENQYINAAVSGGSAGHVTTKFYPYRIQEINNGIVEKEGTSRFWILDTWGLDRNNYDHEEFRHILRGTLPKGFEMNHSLTPTETGSDSKRRVHSVIFFVPIGECILGCETPFLRRLSTFVKQAFLEGTFPLVAISQVDSMYESFPMADVSREITFISKYLGIPKDLIFPIENIVEKKRYFRKECYLFALLQKAASLAAANCLCLSIDEKQKK